MFDVVFDFAVMNGDSDQIKEHLRLQFQALQEQQVQRVQKRLEMRNELLRENSASNDLDNMNLKEGDDDMMDLVNARWQLNKSTVLLL